jgi:hypothetical protein
MNSASKYSPVGSTNSYYLGELALAATSNGLSRFSSIGYSSIILFMLLVVVFLLTSLLTFDMAPFFLLNSALRDDRVEVVVLYKRAMAVVVVILFG